MNVVLIGSGNVATVLGRLIKSAGHTITGIVSRNILHAQALANEFNAEANADFKKINANAGIYILAVSDTSINEVAVSLQLPDKLIVHTSGAVSKNILQNVSYNYGVLYPLQSLRKEAAHIPEIPLFVDGSSAAVTEQIKYFAESISASVSYADDIKRLKLHLCGVVVSNFTNHLYALTADYCKTECTDFSLLVPLIKEVANRTAGYEPKNMQTGPAVRGDMATIDKHLQLLTAYPQLQKIYLQFTESILQFHLQK
ncbi:MAG TPA: DUF2520 domain-containing protein [Panacibacter sp.]|nr:DUF2520 domain-containing protein [Panacibacter sp.]